MGAKSRTKDAKYLKAIRLQQCALAGHGECLGATHAHHATGGKGLGQKNDDSRTFPLCTLHHTERHSFSGFFQDFDKPRLRAWEAEQVARARRLVMGLAESDSLDF